MGRSTKAPLSPSPHGAKPAKARTSGRAANRRTAQAKVAASSARSRTVKKKRDWSKTRTVARRAALWVVRVATVVGLGAGAVGIGRFLHRHVHSSPSFATRSISIQGNTQLSEAEVTKTAGLVVGQNIFHVAPEDAEKRLIAHPSIAHARVERRLPGTYLIELREHAPVAILSLDRLYLVSEEASVFRPLVNPEPMDLPVITGVDAPRFAGSRSYRSEILRASTMVIERYRSLGLEKRAPLQEIHVDGTDFGLYIGSEATLVRLGPPPFVSKLQKLGRVLERLEAERASAAYVLLDNVRRPDRVMVKLR